MKKNSMFGKLALLFVAIAWGSSMVVIKGSTDTLPAGTLLACRFTVAGVILALANFNKLKQIDKDYLKSGIFIGVCLLWHISHRQSVLCLRCLERVISFHLHTAYLYHFLVG